MIDNFTLIILVFAFQNSQYNTNSSVPGEHCDEMNANVYLKVRSDSFSKRPPLVTCVPCKFFHVYQVHARSEPLFH